MGWNVERRAVDGLVSDSHVHNVITCIELMHPEHCAGVLAKLTANTVISIYRKYSLTV